MPSCPAATLLEGPPDAGPSALCGVITSEHQRAGLPASPNDAGVLVTLRRDPSSYQAFCTGAYTKCPVWVAEKQRLEQEKRALSADLA